MTRRKNGAPYCDRGDMLRIIERATDIALSHWAPENRTMIHRVLHGAVDGGSGRSLACEAGVPYTTLCKWWWTSPAVTTPKRVLDELRLGAALYVAAHGFPLHAIGYTVGLDHPQGIQRLAKRLTGLSFQTIALGYTWDAWLARVFDRLDARNPRWRSPQFGYASGDYTRSDHPNPALPMRLRHSKGGD